MKKYKIIIYYAGGIKNIVEGVKENEIDNFIKRINQGNEKWLLNNKSDGIKVINNLHQAQFIEIIPEN